MNKRKLRTLKKDQVIYKRAEVKQFTKKEQADFNKELNKALKFLKV